RTRPDGAMPDSNSATPCPTRDRELPDARATAAIPPCPKDRASPANTSRAARSSRCGSTASNFARSRASTSASTAIHHDPTRDINRRGYLLTCPYLEGPLSPSECPARRACLVRRSHWLVGGASVELGCGDALGHQ